MIPGPQIGKYLAGRSRGLIETLCRCLTRRSKETPKFINVDRHCLVQYSNQASPEHKCTTAPLHRYAITDFILFKVLSVIKCMQSVFSSKFSVSEKNSTKKVYAMNLGEG